MSDLFSYTPPAPQHGNNTPTFSVSEISGALKKTIESAFSKVRIRGELSRVTVAKSGHMYSSLKDENAVIDAICWKGNMGRLSLKPEEGMEVICTGRLTTYPGRSSYQLIIETMELAGEGALLKMLEERKKKLAAEGLFDESRKKRLPFLPQHIGIVTSPTGAVIRDILHRLSDRFPVRVTLWPVMVQGQNAATQIAKAVQRFSTLPQGFDTPDLLIVARGGGSLEDLMPFNEEIVVRAIAGSTIPIISAVGHETDVTLSDFAADKRAPTPTGAAEMAVPVRSELINSVEDYAHRLRQRCFDTLTRHSGKIDDYSHALKRFPRSLEQKQQRLDYANSSLPLHFKSYINHKETILSQLSSSLKTPSELLHSAVLRLEKLDPRYAYSALLQHHEHKIITVSAKLTRPDALLRQKQKELAKSHEYLVKNRSKAIDIKSEKLRSSIRILESLSFKNVLQRGYSVVKDADGRLIPSAIAAQAENRLNIMFSDGTITVKPQE